MGKRKKSEILKLDCLLLPQRYWFKDEETYVLGRRRNILQIKTEWSSVDDSNDEVDNSFEESLLDLESESSDVPVALLEPLSMPEVWNLGHYFT